MIDWTRRVAIGALASISFSVAGERPVIELTLDALGDGRPGVVVRAAEGSDLRAFGLMRIPMMVAGRHSLTLRAVDLFGCVDQTAARREVEVTR